jgi:hypothetical protein
MAEGEFFIQMITCRGRLAEIKPKPGQQFGEWATMADMLLTGQKLPARGFDEGEHPVKVLLAFQEQDAEPISVASVYLLCMCDIEVIEGQRAQSALIQQNPQQKKSQIATPRLIVP